MAAAEYSEDDDALFVLTAAMLTPGQFPGVLGDDYPTACAGLGLDPLDSGYGLVFGQDGSGARWTVATTDAAMVACALAAWDCGLEYDLSPDENSMAASLPGWPLPVAVAVPGVPEPHDPDEGTGGGPPLTPPDASVWGPAQRRLGADEIAIHWREWRDQFPSPDAEAAADAEPAADAGPEQRSEPVAASGTGPSTATDPAAAPAADVDADADADTDADAGPDTDTPADTEQVSDTHTPPVPATAADPTPSATTPAAADDAPDPVPDPASQGSAPAGPATPISHSGVRGVLAAAEEYVRNPPPPGRVRTAYGAIRADGPGWSLVGRTDDMAFVLLDDAPGEVLPVGRGPSLPPLLEALARLASAPRSAAVSPF